jgi:hypothetical protein
LGCKATHAPMAGGLWEQSQQNHIFFKSEIRCQEKHRMQDFSPFTPETPSHRCMCCFATQFQLLFLKCKIRSDERNAIKYNIFKSEFYLYFVEHDIILKFQIILAPYFIYNLANALWNFNKQKIMVHFEMTLFCFSWVMVLVSLVSRWFINYYCFEILTSILRSTK